MGSGPDGSAVVGGGGGTAGGAIGSSFGRKAELMSPMPTKKSSDATMLDVQTVRMESGLTWNDLDKIRAPFPDIRAVVNDDYH